MTRQETLRLLWEKYLHDQQLDATELRQLRELFHDPANEPLAAELLDSVYAGDAGSNPSEYSSQEAFRDVWQKLQQGEPVVSNAAGINLAIIPPADINPPVGNPDDSDRSVSDQSVSNPSLTTPVRSLPVRRSWVRYAAAAVLVLSLGLTIYTFTKKNDGSALADQPTQPIADTLVRPGGNNATLILADGSVVSLNDQANGVVANQGGTNVVKLANGQLAYKGAGKKTASVGFNSIVTPRGGKYQLVLPDGSKVWMNAESMLKYPTSFDGEARQVELTGEAYFEVAKDASKPFRVQLSNMNVEVLGTHFNIMAYSNEEAIATTLVEGSVRVNSAGNKMQLKPGQQALQAGTGNLRLNNSPDIQQVLAWKNDYFQFNNEKVDKLMRQLERWYDVSVVYENGLPDRSFGGKIPRTSPLKDVLKALELSDVHFRVSGKTITVINK